MITCLTIVLVKLSGVIMLNFFRFKKRILTLIITMKEKFCNAGLHRNSKGNTRREPNVGLDSTWRKCSVHWCYLLLAWSVCFFWRTTTSPPISMLTNVESWAPGMELCFKEFPKKSEKENHILERTRASAWNFLEKKLTDYLEPLNTDALLTPS